MIVTRHLTKSMTIAAIMVTAGSFNLVSAADLSAVPSGSYQVDPTHAYINFQYNHLGLSNPTLSFDDFTVDLNLDSANPTMSALTVEIDAGSVITGSDIFKEHLSSADWFDVANHPKIIFTSSKIEANDDGTFNVAGDLNIKGISKPAALTVTINAAMNHPMSGKPVIGADAAGNLLRSDYGLDKFVPYVGDEIALSITAEMVKVE